MPYPGIGRITCPTPFPGLEHVHVYVMRGPNDGVVLVDTAVPMQEAMDRITAGITELGRSLDDIERIYLTHAHPDHFGCAAWLQEASGADVVCHPLAAKAFEAMRDPNRLAGFMSSFAEHGYDAPHPAQRPGGMSLVVPEEVVEIDEGDTVSFANTTWDVYWTPGHEHGHVVFHDPDTGLMVVGDTVLGRITPHIGYQFDPPDPLGQFLDSLDTIARLDPSLMLPGHGRPLDEGADRAMSIKSHHRQRLRRCLELLIRKSPATAMEIATDLFDRELMLFEERLALAETLSHLEYLRLRGRLHREKIDGVWQYGLQDLVP